MEYIYDISIIVVNYNGKRYLHNLFESLKHVEHDEISFEVVLVDNNSADDSVAYIKEEKWDEYINLKVISNEENQGFAKGNNTGVANAEGRYILFLNNDTAVEKRWLYNLYQCILDNSECGMAASKLLFFYDFVKASFRTSDNIIMNKQIQIQESEYSIENKFCKNLLFNEQLTCFGHTEIAMPLLYGDRDYTFKFEFDKYDAEHDYIEICGNKVLINGSEVTVKVRQEKIEACRYSIVQNAGSDINADYDGFDIGMGEIDGEPYNKTKQLNAGCGAAIILKKEDFLRAGQFDERFFMYYEDMDLSFRIRKLGKKILYCPDSVVRHVHTGSSKEWSPFFSYHVYRNKLLFIYKDVSKLEFGKSVLKQFYGGIKNRDKIKLKAVVDALKIVYLNRPVKY